jgi:hypothetical protein
MDWNNSHPNEMDGLEQFPSVTLQYNRLQNTLFTYARQTGIFPADECNAIFPCAAE